MKRAKYRGIPAYFNPDTNELRGANWCYDLLIQLNVWIDVHIIGVEGFPIEVEEDE